MTLAPVIDTEPTAAGDEGRTRGTHVASPDPVRWLLGLLQVNDSFYPTGSYAHSFGLEGMVAEGAVRDRATLREFLLRSVLPALEQTDLPIVAQAWTAWGLPEWDDVAELSFLAAALKSPREARLAAESIGRQRAELLARLQPGSLASDYVTRALAAGWPFSAPVSAALEARLFGAPAPAALAAYAYASIVAVVAAAMKLLRLGQNAAQSLLTEALAATPARIAAAILLPRDDIGWFNPWLDIAAARHESADARMFIS